MNEHDESIIDRHQQQERQRASLGDPAMGSRGMGAVKGVGPAEHQRATDRPSRETRDALDLVVLQDRIESLERVLLAAGQTAEEALTGQGLHVWKHPRAVRSSSHTGRLQSGPADQARAHQPPRESSVSTGSTPAQAPSFQPFLERMLRELNIAELRARQLRERIQPLLRQGPQPSTHGGEQTDEPPRMPASTLEQLLDELGRRTAAHRQELDVLLQDLVV